MCPILNDLRRIEHLDGYYNTCRRFETILIYENWNRTYLKLRTTWYCSTVVKLKNNVKFEIKIQTGSKQINVN